jgi:NAD(P)-dependent dehydrogenase (short-subunit alcohol dehydrogenase family)
MAQHDATRALQGKVALVTGAGRGLGRAFAERLASLGADVAIHGMRENGPAEYGEGSTLTAVAESVAAACGVRTIRVLGDLTQGADIARVVETTTRELVRLTFSSTMPAATSRPKAASRTQTTPLASARRTCARCSTETCSRPSSPARRWPGK